MWLSLGRSIQGVKTNETSECSEDFSILKDGMSAFILKFEA